MIKVVYEITRREEKFIEETEYAAKDLRTVAKECGPHGAKLVSIELCICERCGCGSSVVGHEFICERCNSR